jgi:putative ABC transport system permease protein
MLPLDDNRAARFEHRVESMHAIIRQARANLTNHKLQVALITFTLFAAAALLTIALSTLSAAQGSYNRLFERTHGAHIWLYLDPERVTAGDAERILANLPGVEATTSAMRTLSGVQFFAGEERITNQQLREWPDESVSVSHPLLVAGRAPRPGETKSIALDRNVAATHGVEVGDTIEILTQQGRRPLIVIGLFVSAELCPYPNCNPTRDYLAPGGMTALGLWPPPDPDMEGLAIGLRLQDAEGVEEGLQAAETALPAESINLSLDWKEVRTYSDFSVRFQAVLLTAFSVVAGLASGFLIANAIGQAVRAQTRQIGLLKAVGFTGRQLVLLYLGEYVGLALVASLVGLGVGSLLAPGILRPVVAMFGETLVRPPLWIALVTPSSALLITTLFTLWPVRRAVRLNVVAAIRTGGERPRRRAVRLPHISLSLATGVRDIFSRPLRSVLTALGLGMAVLTLAFALTLQATLQSFIDDPVQIVGDGDLYLGRTPYLPDAEVRHLIAKQPEVAACYSEIWGGFKFPGEEETLSLRARAGDLEDFRFPILEGRMFSSPEEVIVGYGLAKERNLHPGDMVTILLDGEPLQLQVVGTYRETSNLGRMLMLPAETLRRALPEAEPYSYVLKLGPEADDKALAATLRSASGDLLEVEVVSEMTLPDFLAVLPKVMTVLSLVLGGIAVIGVFNSVWMGVQERQREFGLLKAVGMTPGQVTLSVLTGAVVMALVGYAIGLPVGLGGTHLLLNALARQMGFGPLNLPVNAPGLVLVLPGIALVALVGALLPARRAGRVSVVEMLRYE